MFLVKLHGQLHEVADVVKSWSSGTVTRDESHLLGHLLSAHEWLGESTLRDRPSLKSCKEPDLIAGVILC